MPWLLLTEVVRNLSLVFATFFFVLPALFLGFRLSFATEAVVLNEPHLAAAFQSSFKLTDGRFERWLEMVVVSVVLVFSGIFLGAALSVIFPKPGLNAWVAVTQLVIAAMMPIIQYAWTFFYLRLVEVEAIGPGIEVGPAYASTSGPGPSWSGGGATAGADYAPAVPGARPEQGSDPASMGGAAAAAPPYHASNDPVAHEPDRAGRRLSPEIDDLPRGPNPEAPPAGA